MAEDSWTTLRERQRQKWVKLVELFYQQIRYGCADLSCQTPTCLTYQTRVSGRRPYRTPTPSAAKHLASILATDANAISKLCPHALKPMSANDGAFVVRPTNEAYDTKSLVQQLFNTTAWHRQDKVTAFRDLDIYAILAKTRMMIDSNLSFDIIIEGFNTILSTPNIADRSKLSTSLFECLSFQLDALTKAVRVQNSIGRKETLSNLLLLSAALLVSFLGPVPADQFSHFDQTVSEGPIFSANLCKAFGNDLSKYIEIVGNQTANNLALQVLRLLRKENLYDGFFRKVLSPVAGEINSNIPTRSPDLNHQVLATWAKLALRNSWRSESFEVDYDSDANAALMFLDRFKKMFRTTGIDHPFPGRLSFVSQSLDIIRNILSWMKRDAAAGKVYLLDYTWAFTLRERLILFRSANYFLMLEAFEKAKEVYLMFRRTQITIQEAASAEPRNHQVYDRIKPAMTTFLVIQIRRENILEDALSQLWRREQRELRRPLKVRMGMDMGEEGVDLGGVQQEFFRLAIAKALDPELGFFDVDTVTRMAWFRPFSPAPLIQFALTGMLFGLALYNSITLPVTFPEHFYYLLLQRSEKPRKEVGLDTIQDGWPFLHRSLTALLDYEDEDVADVFALDFSFPVDLIGKRIALEMNEDQLPLTIAEAVEMSAARAGTQPEPVDNANRSRYVKTYLSWLLDKSVRPQLDAFLRGFRSVVVDHTLDLFEDEKELKAAVEGTQTISVTDLKRIVRYMDGYTEDMPIIQDFWQVVDDYGQEELRKLLEFVTASERIPAAGIEDLSFVIQKNGVDDDRLPASMTCFGRLLLPHYSSKEVLRDRMRIALENSEGFGIA